MTCYFPLKGYRSKYVNSNGNRSVVFNPDQGIVDTLMSLPCGQCIGCRIDRSRQWAIRCVHEASLFERNCFITLTYNNENLPFDKSLKVRDFQLFMKRLRKAFPGHLSVEDDDGKVSYPIRFFHCGEYGEKFRRPHYHAILFNFDFEDKYLWSESNGEKLYRSPSLEKLWPFGHSSIGSATFKSAAYVARYIMKKVNGDAAKEYYWTSVDELTGEIHKLYPEYITMSRKPGIGSRWFKKYFSDVFPRDEVIVNGKRMKPPKFYDSMFEYLYPDEMASIKEKRVIAADKLSKDNTPRRLAVRRKIKENSLSRLVRNVDSKL